MTVSISKRDAHNLYAGPALNTAGMVYVCFVIVYTGLLLYGLGVLWLHRRKPAVRMRGYLIIIAAVLSIHAYVAALFIVYPLNGAFKCGTEFWYMNTVFPLGIALFQASNVRLWAYANAQHSMMEMKCLTTARHRFDFSWNGVQKWIQQLDKVKKTYFYISLGLLVQIIVAFVLYFGSRRFSPNVGFFGEHANPYLCRRGYEWIPSVLWQFFWTWIYGPIILFKTRHIHDTHFWGLQTRLAVIAGLPGTPLWLAFLYSSNPVLASINQWWPPAMWFAPGLMMMQITSIFFPGYDIYRHRQKSRPRSQCTNVMSSLASDSPRPSSIQRTRELAVNIQAFEHQLKHDLPPLLAFSTEKDFTSENIMFLRDVRAFKLKWRRHIMASPTTNARLSTKDMRTMYEDAAHIYFELVCPGTAKFPINLDSRMYYELEQTFKNLKYEPPINTSTAKGNRSWSLTLSHPSKFSFGPENNDAPSSIAQPASAEMHTSGQGTENSSSSDIGLIDIGIDAASTHELMPLPQPPVSMLRTSSTEGQARRVRFEETNNTQVSEIPTNAEAPPKGRVTNRYQNFSFGASAGVNAVAESFSLNVFDKAFEHIKYLAYTNTWKSFVSALDQAAIEELAAAWSRPNAHTSRRGLKDSLTGKVSRLTDVELYDLNLELQAERKTRSGQELHHGVLDREKGPIPIEQVDSRCAACRNKVERQIQRVVRDAGFRTDDEL